MVGVSLKWLSQYRVHLTFALAAALLLEDLLEGAILRDPDDWADPMGLSGGLLILAGLALRSWAAGALHKNHTLATGGPYSLTRHPLYVGSLLVGLGFTLVIGDDENHWALILLFAIIYVPRMCLEERSMENLFGEQWTSYKRCTGLLLPRRWPQRLRAPWSLVRWWRNREYRAVVFAVVSLMVLDVLSHAHPYPFPWPD